MTLTSEVGLTIRSEHTPEIGYKDNKYPTAGADPKTDLTQINSYSFDISIFQIEIPCKFMVCLSGMYAVFHHYNFLLLRFNPPDAF